MLPHQDCQLSERGRGRGDVYVTVGIMEILSTASSEEGGAWRQAPQRGTISKSVIRPTSHPPWCLSSSLRLRVQALGCTGPLHCGPLTSLVSSLQSARSFPHCPSLLLSPLECLPLTALSVQRDQDVSRASIKGTSFEQSSEELYWRAPVGQGLSWALRITQ